MIRMKKQNKLWVATADKLASSLRSGCSTPPCHHSIVVPMEIRRALKSGLDGCRVSSPAFSRRWEDWEESAVRNALLNSVWRELRFAEGKRLQRRRGAT